MHTTTTAIGTDTERALVGTLLTDSEAVDRALALGLQPAWFGDAQMRRAVRAILAVHERGEEVSVTTVGAEIERTTGARDLAELIDCTLATYPGARIEPLVDLVRRRAMRRYLAHVGREMIAQAEEADEPEEALFAQFLDRLERAARRADPVRRGACPWPEISHEAKQMVERLYRGLPDSIPTGITAVDRLLDGGGLLPQQYAIVAARPGVGKTSLLLDIAANIAPTRPVLICSLEMSTPQLVRRLLAGTAGIPLGRLQHGMSDLDRRLAHACLQEIAHWSLWIDASSLTLGEIRREAQRVRRQCHEPPVVIVDYLQLVALDRNVDRRRNRNEELEQISHGLKALAKELNTPVVALSQLTRDSARAGREPELFDLRDSGAIEQDADLVLMLWTEGDQRAGELREVQVKVAKQRNGPLGRTRLLFNGELTTFRRVQVEAED
ncbi:MAG: AAA family ATPase [Chloroflexi bacterium]|nr:AAA family ATPase [Chloroflexota bacterium]